MHLMLHTLTLLTHAVLLSLPLSNPLYGKTPNTREQIAHAHIVVTVTVVVIAIHRCVPVVCFMRDCILETTRL